MYICKSTSDHITCIRKCKYEYDKLETCKLMIARLKNTKLYGNYLSVWW